MYQFIHDKIYQRQYLGLLVPVFLVYTKVTLNGKSNVVQPFSISNFDNHPSLDSENYSNSQSKHSTIVSISSVLNCVFEQIANWMCVNEAKNFVSNLYHAYFSISGFDTEKQSPYSASLHMINHSYTLK